MKSPVYQFDIGEYQGFILYDASHAHAAGELIVNPIEKELERIAKKYNIEPNNIQVDYLNLLLRVGDQYVLVDAGLPGQMGNLHQGLEELKIGPGDIDTIVITHSDRDHIGGILNDKGNISFPNAQYIMLEDSWQYWSSPEKRATLAKLNRWTKDKARAAWEIYSKIKDLIRLVRSGEEFMPGLKLITALGHRYDHSVLKVTSSGDQLMHISDALAHPLFMENRDWYSTYDASPVQAVDTKVRLLNLCASENILVFGSHFPFPGLGYVQQGHERWRWQPIKAG